MAKAKTMLVGSPAALLKLERERDKARAMRYYQANQLARNKNMQPLRLAREAGCTQLTAGLTNVVSRVAQPRRKVSS